MAINKTAIIGMGALGLLYGNHIQQSLSKDSVSFIVDEERFNKYKDRQFEICGEKKDFTLEIDSKAKPADLVIVAVKYNSLKDALDTMRNVVGENTIIMSVMNGITSEEIIGERYGMNRIIHTVAQGMDAMRFGDSLNYTKMGELRIGVRKGEDTTYLDQVIEFFDRIRMPYTVDEDIIYRMWGKFMLNVGINQICMMHETTYAGALGEGEAHDDLIGAMEEVIKIGNAEGVPLTKKDMDYYIDILHTLSPDGVPSMRQDGIAKRKTEVDMFAGTVIDIAKKHDIPVPINEKIYRNVKKMEEDFA